MKKNLKKRSHVHAKTGLSWKIKLWVGASLLGVVLGLFLWLSGLFAKGVMVLDQGFQDMLKTRGFVVQDILLKGRQKLSRDNILKALNVQSGSGIFESDPQRIKARLEALPWVAAVSVQRLLPSQLVIHLDERLPIALWQHDGKLDLLGGKKVVIPCDDPLKYRHLPQLVGPGAEVYGEYFLKILRHYPKTLAEIKSIVRVSNRRWDLHLKNKMIVKLPDLKYQPALKKFEQLIEDKNILNRDIYIIDFRLPKKFIVQYKEVEKK